MSIEPASLPAGQAASEPAWVRNGSASVQRDYAVGLQFEGMLMRELTSSLTASAGLGEGGGEEGASSGGAEAGSGVLSSMVSGALADGVGAGGGLGLAAELTRDMQSRVGTAPLPGAAQASPSAQAPAVAGGTQAATTGGTSA
jgi:hypothetical protein